MAGRLRLARVSLRQANAFVAARHRHHGPTRGHVFSVGAEVDGRLVGVAIVGRPVARGADDGSTAEVTRLCTDGHRNACSFLLGAAARAAFAVGFTRVQTYSLPIEGGASLRAAGWREAVVTKGGQWSRAGRHRAETRLCEPKVRWERVS